MDIEDADSIERQEKILASVPENMNFFLAHYVLTGLHFFASFL